MKNRMDFETERRLKKELHALLVRLLDEVAADRNDEEGAMNELNAFFQGYGVTSQTEQNVLRDAALQKVQMEKAQQMAREIARTGAKQKQQDEEEGGSD